jgi:hypothetical protein
VGGGGEPRGIGARREGPGEERALCVRRAVAAMDAGDRVDRVDGLFGERVDARTI